VAVTEALDRFGFAIGDIKPVDDNRFDLFRVVIGDGAAIDNDIAEPALASMPVFVGFDEPTRLDPKRVGLTWEVPGPRHGGLRPLSSLGSLLLHLLPFLILIAWPTTANDDPPIPIQLVIVEPPPPPPPPPAPEVPQPPKPPEAKPPVAQGRLASQSMGEVTPKTNGDAPTVAPPALGEKQAIPTEALVAAVVTPPPLPPPKPSPPREKPAVQLPKPSGTVAPKTPEPPHDTAHAAKFAGPAATRDEYLAYLVTLTKQHLDLLPRSVIGTRRGETAVLVAVQLDGLISRISIARSSGYPDIDQRIVQMVSAVHKFPPVPQAFQGNTIELELRLRFPDALERD
jgi:TonB family protein